MRQPCMYVSNNNNGAAFIQKCKIVKAYLNTVRVPSASSSTVHTDDVATDSIQDCRDRSCADVVTVHKHVTDQHL